MDIILKQSISEQFVSLLVCFNFKGRKCKLDLSGNLTFKSNIQMYQAKSEEKGLKRRRGSID